MLQIDLTLVLTLFNSIVLAVAGIMYFNKTYTIQRIEDWNTLAAFYNDHADEYDEDGEPIKEEKAGGFGIDVGFGADYLQDDEEDEE